jgi:hypothetical protein
LGSIAPEVLGRLIAEQAVHTPFECNRPFEEPTEEELRQLLTRRGALSTPSCTSATCWHACSTQARLSALRRRAPQARGPGRRDVTTGTTEQ